MMQSRRDACKQTDGKGIPEGKSDSALARGKEAILVQDTWCLSNLAKGQPVDYKTGIKFTGYER